MRSVKVTSPLRGARAIVWATLMCGAAFAEPAAGGPAEEPLLAQQPQEYPPPPPGYQPPPSYPQPAPNYPPPNEPQPPPGYSPPAPSYQPPPPGYPQYPPPPPPGYQPQPNYPPYAPPPNYPQAPPNYAPPAPNSQAMPPGGGEPPLAAVWTPRELRFVFMGFTAKYSCDGLRERIRAVLLKLGARPDLEVRQGPCSAPLGTPTAFPGVTIKMNVLEPAGSESYVNGGAPPQVVPAHWKRVDLTASNDAVKLAGDCEIIEQIKQSILPKFTTRNVDYKSTCIPNQLTVGGTQLRADVLIADAPRPPASAAR